MRILLVSTYELGHQPLHLASPAAALGAAGHDVRCLDLSVEPWDDAAIGWADGVAFSVPMHTAMRLAMRAALSVRTAEPGKPVCFYGLYAPVSRDLTIGTLADRVIGGEYEPGLVAWADDLGAAGDATVIGLERGSFALPRRALLPPLERYAHLALDGIERVVGYVEGSHGCAHECRHCPVPVTYAGRIRLVPSDVVLGDIDQLVALGARHITFGDPDFLNGWRHSLELVRAMHERHPQLTFDCTTKVDHILERAALWDELARCGCLFVVSALESVNDTTLERLDKGHTTADAEAAIGLLRGHEIEVRPSFLPFTPWTTPRDVLDILEFVIAHDMLANVDPVQYSIRLLLPEGSLLLEHPDVVPYLGPYDPELLTYTWRSADPACDALQRRVADVVQTGARNEEPPGATFLEVYALVSEAAGETRDPILAGSVEGRPRLTEPWFC
ncbi:MAG: CUAEP/CCAEP-tail radical SAM (seleno)protein [Actinomycetota bacterium]